MHDHNSYVAIGNLYTNITYHATLLRKRQPEIASGDPYNHLKFEGVSTNSISRHRIGHGGGQILNSSTTGGLMNSLIVSLDLKLTILMRTQATTSSR